jgi:PAS domain S-box-containing protein
VIGKTDADMPWKAQAAKLKAIDLEIMKSGQARKYELELERADGSVHRERVSKMPLHDRHGDIIGVLGCYEDVTERLSGDFKT